MMEPSPLIPVFQMRTAQQNQTTLCHLNSRWPHQLNSVEAHPPKSNPNLPTLPMSPSPNVFSVLTRIHFHSLVAAFDFPISDFYMSTWFGIAVVDFSVLHLPNS
ncbi:hypothetical protein PGT21_001082 [Puccinia graminis f. sp. tritici]|uniref:Uncharacterized protein n=1 Tax=Puccinia graminis f. sp. tritici TaxID=56615 RepID=A0A5B0NFC3_PUCGR|nr:hypothetical protein PGT21_001082 [Puccinia graminis f. sp. tritici]KAA1111343.1 hypothetical protein PGTUg99_002237 [Puccinia graminis f. sp. tritici]